MYCKNCGFHMADDHLICQNCGTKKGEGSAFCDQCGNVINVSSAFCTNCGKKIEVAAAAGNVQNNQTASYSQTPYSQQTTAQQFRSQAQQPSDQYLPPKKYCRNCGSAVLNSQAVCTKCGVKVGEGSAHCQHCGANTQPGAEYCLSCGKSLKVPFNIGKYFNEFADNFVAVFKTPDKKSMLFDNFINFAAVLVFIVMLLPTISIAIPFYGAQYINTFGTNVFAGILLILSLLTAAMKYEPFSAKFMSSKPELAKFYVFITPALELIALVIIVVNLFILKTAAALSYNFASVHFTFFAWLLLLLILASIADSIYLFITQNKKQMY